MRVCASGKSVHFVFFQRSLVTIGWFTTFQVNELIKTTLAN